MPLYESAPPPLPVCSWTRVLTTSNGYMIRIWDHCVSRGLLCVVQVMQRTSETPATAPGEMLAEVNVCKSAPRPSDVGNAALMWYETYQLRTGR